MLIRFSACVCVCVYMCLGVGVIRVNICVCVLCVCVFVCLEKRRCCVKISNLMIFFVLFLSRMHSLSYAGAITDNETHRDTQMNS